MKKEKENEEKCHLSGTRSLSVAELAHLRLAFSLINTSISLSISSKRLFK